MSIKRLHAINELSHEIRLLNANIRKHERDLIFNLDYIEDMSNRFCNPKNNINKYVQKNREIYYLLESLRKTRWFLKKERQMWRQGHDYL